MNKALLFSLLLAACVPSRGTPSDAGNLTTVTVPLVDDEREAERLALTDERRKALREIVEQSSRLVVETTHPLDTVVSFSVSPDTLFVGTYRFNEEAAMLVLVDVAIPRAGRVDSNLPPWVQGPLLFVSSDERAFELEMTDIPQSMRVVGHVDSVMLYAEAE